jgi:hypothetical protein
MLLSLSDWQPAGWKIKQAAGNKFGQGNYYGLT